MGKLSLPERKGYVTDRGLCWACLDTGHSTKMCQQRLICSVCTKRHSSILHDDNFVLRYGTKTQLGRVVQQSGNAEAKLTGKTDVYSVDTTDYTVYHGVLPVLIYANNYPEKSILTYDLYDNGSTGCFLTNELCERLEILCEETSLTMCTMHEMSVTLCQVMVDIMVADVKGKNPIYLPKTYSRHDIPVGTDKIPISEVISRWAHLSRVAEDMPKFYGHVSIGVLIGSNCPSAMQPLEVIPSVKGSPYAVRLQHGWEIYGPVQAGISGNTVTSNRNQATPESTRNSGELL